MNIGDRIYTPRFCTVRIKEIFESREAARENGYKEPTYYDDNTEWGVVGKSLDMYHMVFAAYRK